MKTVLLLLSIAAAALTVFTFGGWVTLWGWDSPLWYSAILVVGAVSLYPQMMRKRGLDVDHSTVFRWVQRSLFQIAA